MSLLGLFDVGKTAIFASQTALKVTGHNIANVNTPGFSRQEAVLSQTSPIQTGVGYIGRGVSITTIRRNYDSFLNDQLLGQEQSYGKAAVLTQGFAEVEQVFNEAKSLGLMKDLDAFFAAWHDVANNPEGEALRTVLLQKAGNLVRSAQRMELKLEEIVQRANEDLSATIDNVNKLAVEIADLNGMIHANATHENNDLLDKRDKLMAELGELIEFDSFERDNGGLVIIVGRRNLVDETRVSTIRQSTDSNNDVVFSMDGVDVTRYVGKGRVGGYLELREQVRSTALEPFRQFIGALVDEVNAQHRQGFGLDGVGGRDFFEPSSTATADVIRLFGVALTGPEQVAAARPAEAAGAAFGNFVADPGETVSFTIGGVALSFTGTGDPALDATAFYNALLAEQGANVTLQGYVFSDDGAGTVSVTGAVSSPVSITGWGGSDPSSDTRVDVTALAGSSSTQSALDDQAATGGAPVTSADVLADPGLPGNNLNALSMTGLQSSEIAALNTDFNDYYGSIVTTVGVKSGSASDAHSFEETLLDDLQQRRESVSGVSLDEEAANMMRFQRAFQAGARMITVTDELIQVVLEMV